jgi:glycosyltransferase involved in cell wall biosynthesis
MGVALSGPRGTMTAQTIDVCEVIPGISVRSGGPSIFISDLSRHLPADDFRFTLVTEGLSQSGDMSIDSRFKLTRIAPSLASLGLPSSSRTYAALDATNNDIALNLVHCHGLWRNIGRITAKWCRDNNIPLVISPHGTLEPWALAHRPFKKKVALSLYQRRDLAGATAFHACSEKEAEGIRRFGLKQPIAVIPNGTTLPQSTQPLRPSAKNKLKTALFLSRIHPVKGLPMLLEAWQAAGPPDWRLIIAGTDDGNYLSAMKRKAKDLNLERVVEFIGPLFGEGKDSAFRNADMFVLPSYSENFGIVVAEALSYGVPVLATTGCPWSELETRDCGWWVDPTVDGIRAGLTHAFSSTTERRSQMGQRGRVLVLQRYQWPAIASRFRDFYRWIATGGPRPDFVT